MAKTNSKTIKMKNQKMQNGTSIRELSIFLNLLNDKLKTGETYSLKIFNMEKLLAYVGIYQDQELIFTTHLFHHQLNALLKELSFTKKEMFDIIFEKEEVHNV